MRSTLTLDELIEEARRITGIKDKSAVIRAALQALIAKDVGRRLAALGGTMPDFNAGRRRRPKITPSRSRHFRTARVSKRY